ncbi:MAG: polysaccharide deacetylase family protein [Gammaproteobacteria bacterium]|nr:polysaccharide deacetylase family protein [Gammaproteobacteria bacterium]
MTSAARSRLSGEVIILMYHHCAPLPPDAVMRGLYVTPRQFAWQLDWLRSRGVRFCTFADLEQPSEVPRVMVTFDDGLRDVHDNAFPILAERGIPAVVFPVVGDIGLTGVVWHENKDKSPQTLMTAAQIREMTDAGHEFGSHLWEHRKASRLPAAELREQLHRSRATLAGITGREVVSIAYPYGDYSPEVVAATAEAGYRYAVTTTSGSNRDAPVLELRRFAVKGVRFYHPLRFIRTFRRALAEAA